MLILYQSVKYFEIFFYFCDMPRVKLFDETQALGQALDLFWEKGYEATSLGDLTKKMGIGKGSFYDTFGSKRKLFDKCLSTYQASSFEVLEGIFSRKGDPLDTIKALFDLHTNMMLKDTGSRGCFIANSTTELADDEKVQAFLEEHNQVMRAKFVKLLAGSLWADQSEVYADLILTHFTGISVMSKFIKDPERFRQANEVFLKVFE